MSKTPALALALLIAAGAASAQTRANPYDNGAQPLPDLGRIDGPALSSTTRSAVQAEYIRARNAGEISVYDNHAEAIRLADLMPRRPAAQTAVAGR